MTPLTEPPTPNPVLPRGLSLLVGAAALVILVAGLRGISGLLGPIFLALVLTVSVTPAVHALRRRGFPGWLATLIGILAVYLILVVLAGSLIYAAAELAAALPAYGDQFNALLDAAVAFLQDLGIRQEEITDAIRQLDIGSVVGVLQDVLSQVAGVATDLLLILLVLLFMGIDAAGFDARLAAVRAQRADVVTAMSAFASGTRRFLWVTTLFGVVVAILDMVALWIIGVPLALVWGLLAFITNYLPNIGFFVGLVPPALLALLEGGPGAMIAVIAAYLAINFVVQTLAQPKIVGQAVGLSTSVTFLALVFWGWVIGLLGALLAVPLTLMVKALLVDANPGNRWIATLMSAKPPAAEPEPEQPKTPPEPAGPAG